MPSLTAERARRLQAQGLHYLHCPVFMGSAAARMDVLIAAGHGGKGTAVLAIDAVA